MTNFPVRKLSTPGKIIAFPGDFVIRPLEPLISGKDMIQESHRHDFYFILALGKASGDHMIDFEPYKVCNCSVFFLRPGQVHQLTLRTGSKGYLMQFTADFFNPESREANQLLRRAAKKNACYPDADGYKRLDALLHSIYQEFTGKQDGYQEIIKASLIIFFVELIRQKQESADTSTGVTTYQKARLEEFLELLETHVATHKKASQ
jgi:hypothetical protein